jgi:hypothetical protein
MEPASGKGLWIVNILLFTLLVGLASLTYGSIKLWEFPSGSGSPSSARLRSKGGFLLPVQVGRPIARCRLSHFPERVGR